MQLQPALWYTVEPLLKDTPELKPLDQVPTSYKYVHVLGHLTNQDMFYWPKGVRFREDPLYHHTSQYDRSADTLQLCLHLTFLLVSKDGLEVLAEVQDLGDVVREWLLSVPVNHPQPLHLAWGGKEGGRKGGREGGREERYKV